MELLDVARGGGISLLGQPILDRQTGNPFKFLQVVSCQARCRAFGCALHRLRIETLWVDEPTRPEHFCRFHSHPNDIYLSNISEGVRQQVTLELPKIHGKVASISRQENKIGTSLD
jgi:hypothetical protein